MLYWFLFRISPLQILSQANQSQSQQHAPPSSASSSSSSQIPPPPSLPPPPPGLSPAQFILHGSLPLVGCTKTPPSHLHPSIGGGCAQTPPPILPGVTGNSGDAGWENESKDPDKVKFTSVYRHSNTFKTWRNKIGSPCPAVYQINNIKNRL